jgi:predicted ArsR family transcriptional regulator
VSRGGSQPPNPTDQSAAERERSADEFSAAVSAVTSAFGDPTRREIYLFARSSEGGVTASEVAERFALHTNVARHHLEKLTGGGYLTVELARHESAGRPSKCYRATDVASTLSFPPRRDELLATLLARSLELLDPKEAEAMADDVGFEYGKALAARMAPVGTSTSEPALSAHKSVRAALAVVADALTAHGFAAHTEKRGKLPVIVAEQCPFGGAAQQYPHVVCAVDRGMIRGMLAALYGETDPRFTETRPSGDEHCVAHV